MIKLLNINQNDWDKVVDIARHLGRGENELSPTTFGGYDAAICLRKKPTDRQYQIMNTDKGLIVVMDADDMNYIEPMLECRTYLCRLHDNKYYYRVYVKSICDNIITADYQPFEDEELTKPLHSIIKSTEWQIEWVTEYKEIT